MASLIKNQILKHLSKFAKNLTVDQITVEVLKGTGALENIELNEVVLTEVLELPVWLRVQKATCNKIGVKIPWTSLKTSAVKLYIDEIRVEMVMSSDLQERPSANSSSTPGANAEHSPSAAYNFANRVVEGMSLYINTVEVSFTSERFGGSFLLSRLCVESRTPTWKETTDLHQTRIKDLRLQQVLIFKQVSWQLLRVEASNLAAGPEGDETRHSSSEGYNMNAPLRLLTNQGRCRISMKKSTIDGSVVAGRLQLILGDILWVATLPQVRSAINFYSYVMELIRKAAELNKTQKAEKLRQQADLVNVAVKNTAASGSKLAPPLQQRGGGGTISDVFQHYDVAETSYHLYGARIDLHICDEASDEAGSAKSEVEGALQISLQKLSIDFYPYHLAVGERNSWIYYKDRICRQWTLSLLDSYYRLFSSKLDATTREQFQNEWPKLMAQCCVVRLDDITVYCLTRAGDKGSPEKLLSCDREVLKLPDDMPVLHAEFSDYYYAGDQCRHLPLPPSNTHVQWNPVRVFLDYKTLRWISYVYLEVCNTLGLQIASFESVPHHDVHVEAMMPRLVIPTNDGPLLNSSGGHCASDAQPTMLYVQAASVVLENSSVLNSTRVQQDALKDYVSQLKDCLLFDGNNEELFVGGERLVPLPTQTDAFRAYLTMLCEKEQCALPMTSGRGTNQGTTNAITPGTAGTDVWTVSLSPVWIDFYRKDSVHYPRQLPFVSDIPLTLWLVPNAANTDANPSPATVTVLIRADGALKVLMDCNQYQFLHRVLDDVADLLKTLMGDANRLANSVRSKGDANESTVSSLSCCLSCLVPTVDISLLLPLASDSATASGEPSDRSISRSSLELSTTAYPANAEATDTKSLSVEAISVQENALPGDSASEFQPGSFNPNVDIASIDVPLGAVVMEDAVSVVTDVSDMDEDNFVQIDSPDVAPFDDVFQSSYQQRQRPSIPRTGHRTIEAMDAYEEEKERLCDHNRTTALIDRTTRLLQRKVSTVTFRLRQSQVAFAYAGDESRLVLLAPKVDADENHDITLEEAHRILNTKAPIDPNQFRNIDRISIDNFPLVIRAGFRDSADPGYINVDAQNVGLTMMHENLLQLSDFVPVETPQKRGGATDAAGDSTMNMRIRIKDSSALLKDAHSSPPIRVQLDRVRVFRTSQEGVQLKVTNEDEEEKMVQLERENAELREKLNEAKALIQRLAKDNFHVAL